jgi:PAS domain S-box-containing protein
MVASESPVPKEKNKSFLRKKIQPRGKTIREEETLKLINELENQRLKLELQNRELRLTAERAQMALKKLTTLYDFAPMGYFTLTRYGFILDVNLSGAKLIGMKRREIKDRNFNFFVSPDTFGAFESFLRKVFKTGTKQCSELKLIVDGGRKICVYIEGVISADDQQCLVTAVDITERKTTEEALKKSETRLRELNATKDKFFSIISHDLRSPFSSIIGFSDLLLEKVREKDYEMMEEYAEIIQSSSWRVMNLLINLIEWSNSQTGTIKFNPEYFEIVDLVNEVTALSNDTARHKAITITRELPDSQVVFADKEMISTVLRNLISNSIKYTNPEGEIIVSVKQEGEEISVSVQDNGIGIEKNALEKLFRIEESRSTKGTRKETGTGLGLLLCKEFIEKHGGRLSVESKPGVGSDFRFSLPVKQPD